MAGEIWQGFIVDGEPCDIEDEILSSHDDVDISIDVCNIGDGQEGVTYQTEFARLRANLGAVDGPVFQNMMVKASEFLIRFAREFGMPDNFDAASYFRRWMSRDISLRIFENDSAESMWIYAGTVPEWGEFSMLARRIVAIIPSESEVERTISVQRGITGMKGTHFGQRVFTARTQLHTIREDFE
jgi:hypothetical protein